MNATATFRLDHCCYYIKGDNPYLSRAILTEKCNNLEATISIISVVCWNIWTGFPWSVCSIIKFCFPAFRRIERPRPTTYHANMCHHGPCVQGFDIHLYSILESECLKLSLDIAKTAHYDVIKRKHFPRYTPFGRGTHRSPVDSPHKRQWRRALMFSLTCVLTNAWANNREAGDLTRHRPLHSLWRHCNARIQ